MISKYVTHYDTFKFESVIFIYKKRETTSLRSVSLRLLFLLFFLYLFGAEIFHRTFFAICLSCGTDIPSEKYASMAKIIGFFGREKFSHSVFYLSRLVCFYKSQTVAKTDEMSIRNNGGLAVNITYDQIGGFSSDARKCNELFNCIGNFSAKILGDFLADFY